MVFCSAARSIAILPIRWLRSSKTNKTVAKTPTSSSPLGGDPNAAYRIARTLRRLYPLGKLTFFLGGYCKSAGTLLALCADELVFSSFGELGPLDVQIGKPNELVGAESGLDLTQALKQLSATAFESFEEQLVAIVNRSSGAITTKMAAEIATKLTVGL